MNNFSKMMILGKSGETTNKNDQDMRNTGNNPYNEQGDRMTSEMLGRTPYNYNDNEYVRQANEMRRDRMGMFDTYETNGGMPSSHYDSPESRRSNMHVLPKSKIGFSSYDESNHEKKLDHRLAEEWVRGMKNADGTSGAHWTFDQAKNVMAQHNVSGVSPEEFWAVLNSVYSDYCKVAKKFGVDRLEFYTEIAKAWLNDEDAEKDKAAMYFEYIVQK